jgi:hypothetical protein
MHLIGQAVVVRSSGLGPGTFRDASEAGLTVRIRGKATEGATQVGPFAVLEALGVRVREVDDLAEGAVYVESHRLLVVDRDLSLADLEDYVCELLGIVAAA